MSPCVLIPGAVVHFYKVNKKNVVIIDISGMIHNQLEWSFLHHNLIFTERTD